MLAVARRRCLSHAEGLLSPSRASSASGTRRSLSRHPYSDLRALLCAYDASYELAVQCAMWGDDIYVSVAGENDQKTARLDIGRDDESRPVGLYSSTTVKQVGLLTVENNH